jgi:DNA-binding transcriptional ArsR family regulator
VIFSPAMLRLLRDGRKTQTRRPRKDHPCPYKPGRVYALQTGRGQPALEGEHVRITDRRKELLGEITEDDARREGFKGHSRLGADWVRVHEIPEDEARGQSFDARAEFASYWIHLHDAAWWMATQQLFERLPATVDDLVAPLDLTVRAVRGRLRRLERAGAVTVDDDGQWSRTEDGAEVFAWFDRFRTHHAHRPVWVLDIEIERDASRYLTGPPAAASGKARVQSTRKVTPNRAREAPLTDDETHGYARSAPRGLHGGYYDDHGNVTATATGARAPEPEAVDEATQRRFSEKGTMLLLQEVALRDAKRESQALHDRLRDVRREANELGVDIRRQELSIRKRIKALEGLIEREKNRKGKAA